MLLSSAFKSLLPVAGASGNAHCFAYRADGCGVRGERLGKLVDERDDFAEDVFFLVAALV